MNTDQGAQFISDAWISRLNQADREEELNKGLTRYVAWYNTLRTQPTLPRQTLSPGYSQTSQPQAADPARYIINPV